MQAIFETLFDVVYLTAVSALGIIITRNAGKHKDLLLFGLMAVVLSGGNAFLLMARIATLWSDMDMTVALGIGQFVELVAMTAFFVLLFEIWRIRYNREKMPMAASRVALCLFPQNGWLTDHPPVAWAVWRTLPFVLLGIIIAVLYFKTAKRPGDRPMRLIWLAVVLSIVFAVPGGLWRAVPELSLFAILEMCTEVWIVIMGYCAGKTAAESV
jgi:hypothetical protein